MTRGWFSRDNFFSAGTYCFGTWRLTSYILFGLNIQLATVMVSRIQSL